MSHTYQIRQATLNDVAAMAICGREFDAEGPWYPEALDDEELYADLAAYVVDENHVAVIAEKDGIPAGFCVFGLGKATGRKMIEGLMVWFYTRKNYRNYLMAADLLDYSLALCKDKGAKIFFASATAGFLDGGTNERAFAILLKRRKFELLGSVYRLQGG